MKNPNLSEITQIMSADFPEGTRELIRNLAAEEGMDYLEKLVFLIPGYSVNILIIEFLPFDPELWLKLYNKAYFTSELSIKHWTDKNNSNLLKETKMDLYFKSLNDKVVDRKFFDIIRTTYKNVSYPSQLAFNSQYTSRMNELSNARDFILDS